MNTRLSLFSQRPAGKHSMSQNDSCKNLLALIDSSNHPSNASNHSPAVTMSESEARTMACDFDYGVQVRALLTAAKCTSVFFHLPICVLSLFQHRIVVTRCGFLNRAANSSFSEGINDCDLQPCYFWDGEMIKTCCCTHKLNKF